MGLCDPGKSPERPRKNVLLGFQHPLHEIFGEHHLRNTGYCVGEQGGLKSTSTLPLNEFHVIEFTVRHRDTKRQESEKDFSDPNESVSDF